MQISNKNENKPDINADGVCAGLFGGGVLGKTLDAAFESATVAVETPTQKGEQK